jgi:metal-responsive CopG/Arc/MetJ family transcriptional regulator
MRVNMTINDELLGRIDNYAKTNYMNRSSVVSFACNQFLLQNELSSLLVSMKRAFETIAVNGSCSDEQMKELDKFAELVEILVSDK